METTIHLTKRLIFILNTRILKTKDHKEQQKMLESRKFLMLQLFDMEQNEKAAKEYNQ